MTANPLPAESDSPQHFSPDARIIRPEDQPQTYTLLEPTVQIATPGARPASDGSFAGGVFRELIGTVLPAVLIALLIHLFLAQATRVEGFSMEPTLFGHQRLVIEKLSYRLHEPNRGDIVVVHVPGYGREMLIKRVIGLPGETVEVRNGQVLVNGAPLEEPYLRTTTNGSYPTTVVPEGSVFVMGDNRNNSNDSRSFGAIPDNDIVGKAWLRYWPLTDLGMVN